MCRPISSVRNVGRSYSPLLLLVSLLCLGQPVRAQQVLYGQVSSQATICPADLNQRIAAIVDRPQFSRARWGILVQALSSNPVGRQALYQREAPRYFIPASTAKLLTTAAAWQKLGPQFRIRTSIYQSSQNPRVLRVVGRGDPTLTDANLEQLGQQLKQRGIQQVDLLLADDRYFRGSPYHPDWAWEDVQSGYGAPVNSLILNQNAIGLALLPQALGQPLAVKWDNPAEGVGWTIENDSVTVPADAPEWTVVGRDMGRSVLRVSGQLRVGSEPDPAAVAIPDPTENFLRQLQAVLRRQQIQVLRTGIATEPLNSTEREVAAIESPPLSELVYEINQTSNNLYAEALLKILGASGNLKTSSLKAGLTAVETVLTRAGVDPLSYQLADSSGLSRKNLISPEALVQTLQAMAPIQGYRATLLTTATEGSLRNRLKALPNQAVVQAKTGTLSGVVALAGYITTPTFPPLAFSIVVNQTDLPAREARSAIDEVVVLLAHLKNCGSLSP